MSTNNNNNNNSTEHHLGPATHNNLATEYPASQGERQSIEEYFGPGGAFWTLPITSNGQYIFDGTVSTAGKGNSKVGDADATDASMDISMGDNTNSSATNDNGTGDTATSKTNASDSEEIKDEDLFRAFLVSDIDDSNSSSPHNVATRASSPEHQASTSHQSTRDPSPTSTRPSTAQQIDTSSPLSDYREVEVNLDITDDTITSSPPAAPQKRSSRAPKISKPSNIQRRTTRSMKGAEKSKPEVKDENEVESRQPKLVPIVDASEGEGGGGKSVMVRKRQQPKPKVEASEAKDGKVSKSKSLAVRKRQQPQRAVNSTKK